MIALPAGIHSSNIALETLWIFSDAGLRGRTASPYQREHPQVLPGWMRLRLVLQTRQAVDRKMRDKMFGLLNASSGQEELVLEMSCYGADAADTLFQIKRKAPMLLEYGEEVTVWSDAVLRQFVQGLCGRLLEQVQACPEPPVLGKFSDASVSFDTLFAVTTILAGLDPNWDIEAAREQVGAFVRDAWVPTAHCASERAKDQLSSNCLCGPKHACRTVSETIFKQDEHGTFIQPVLAATWSTMSLHS